jgi:hypothetical protein
MPAEKSTEGKQQLDRFFRELNEFGLIFHHYVGKAPSTLVINPDIVAGLSRVEGFYQRPELRAMVTASAPVVRYFKLDFGVVTLVDDWEEQFLHYE